MSEIRVDNILSSDGTTAPFYSKGVKVSAGQTFTNEGDYVVDGTSTFKQGAVISGLTTFSSGVSDLNVVGVATFSDGAYISGLATFTSGVSGLHVVGGAATFSQGLVVTGLVTFTQGLDIDTNANYTGIVTAAQFEGDGTRLQLANPGVSSTGISTAKGWMNDANITASLDLDDFYGNGSNCIMGGPITVKGSNVNITVGAGVSYIVL